MIKKKLISVQRKILANRENEEHNFPIARNSSVDITFHTFQSIRKISCKSLQLPILAYFIRTFPLIFYKVIIKKQN